MRLILSVFAIRENISVVGEDRKPVKAIFYYIAKTHKKQLSMSEFHEKILITHQDY